MSCKFNDGFVDCAGREVWMRLPNDGSPAAAREIDSADVHSFNRTKVKPLEIVYIYPIGKFTDDIKCGQRPLHENDEVTDFAEQGACLLALNNR
ncbi:MAG TPA: hypothetical protein PK839_09940 [Tenuifilaceae bacterium]|mgnify:CR=1 FL=1|jgi:hypothetical protein|nr:hypothetical protein [Bacteroidales bacterium]HOG73094.1 hypothetical protein [Tenuifilaceae bacterium]